MFGFHALAMAHGFAYGVARRQIDKDRAYRQYARQRAMYQQANDADVIEGECVRVEEPKALPSPEKE